MVVAAKAGRLSPRGATTRLRWLLVTFASIATATVIVVLTTRPWAEYMYGLTICAMIAVGAAAGVLLRPIDRARLLAPAALLTVLTLIIVLPSHYKPGPRPIYEGVQRLHPIQTTLQQPGSVLVAQEDANELCNYLAYAHGRLCAAEEWPALRAQITPQTSVALVLEKVHATAIYANASMLADPSLASLLSAPGAHGWRELARGSGPSGPWRVLVRDARRGAGL